MGQDCGSGITCGNKKDKEKGNKWDKESGFEWKKGDGNEWIRWCVGLSGIQ